MAERLCGADADVFTPFLRPDAVRDLWRQHKHRQVDHGYVVWTLLTLGVRREQAAERGSPMLERALAEQLSVVIPAHNEEMGIPVVLEALARDCPGAEVIVVDNASSDRTAALVARCPDVLLVRLSYNRGKGHALKTGMRLATRPYVAWFDADNEHRTEDLIQLVERVSTENLVAAIGQRATGSTNLVRAIGKGVIRTIGRGLKIHAGSDLICGKRVFRRRLSYAIRHWYRNGSAPV